MARTLEQRRVDAIKILESKLKQFGGKIGKDGCVRFRFNPKRPVTYIEYETLLDRITRLKAGADPALIVYERMAEE